MSHLGIALLPANAGFICLCSLYLIHTMFYSVSYSAYVCDDGVPERVTCLFDDFVNAVAYWADCSETEDECVISLTSPKDDPDDLPF